MFFYLQSHADHKETQVNAFVCDVTEEDLCDRLAPSSVDIVTLVRLCACLSFVFFCFLNAYDVSAATRN